MDPRIDRSIASAPVESRLTLEKLRKLIHSCGAREETISYGMPAFGWHGEIAAGFLLNKKHIAFYPFSGNILQQLKKETAGFPQTKSALHLPLAGPLPAQLLRQIIRLRKSEIDSAAKQSSRKTRKPGPVKTAKKPAAAKKGRR